MGSKAIIGAHRGSLLQKLAQQNFWGLKGLPGAHCNFIRAKMKTIIFKTYWGLKWLTGFQEKFTEAQIDWRSTFYWSKDEPCTIFCAHWSLKWLTGGSKELTGTHQAGLTGPHKALSKIDGSGSNLYKPRNIFGAQWGLKALKTQKGRLVYK